MFLLLLILLLLPIHYRFCCTNSSVDNYAILLACPLFGQQVDGALCTQKKTRSYTQKKIIMHRICLGNCLSIVLDEWCGNFDFENCMWGTLQTNYRRGNRLRTNVTLKESILERFGVEQIFALSFNYPNNSGEFRQCWRWGLRRRLNTV